jgi:LPXTG-motif cell wall-anchored protein
MKKTYKLAAVFAVFLFALPLLCGAALAEEAADPPGDETVIGTLLPPGTGTVVDIFNSDDGRKFYTIQTPAGNTFYLIIDFTRTAENVYFLDAVNEKDLLALAEKAKVTGGVPISPGEVTPSAEPTPGNPADPKPQNNNGMTYIVAAAVLIAGGAGFYFKKRGKKAGAAARDDYDDYDEPEYGGNEYGADQTADIPDEWRDDDD